MARWFRALFTWRSLVRLALWLGALVMLLVALALLAVVVINVRGERKWQRYLKEAAARGVEFDFAKFIPPADPDEENFAAIPLFAEVFAADARGESIPERFRVYGPRRAPSAPAAAPRKPYDPGTLPQPMDLASWSEEYVAENIPPADEVENSNPAAAVIAGLEQYEPHLEGLRTAANRPRCRFPVDWVEGSSASQPHWSVVMGAVGVERRRIYALVHLGRAAEALEELKAMLRMLKLVSAEPTLIAHLTRDACLTRVLDAMGNALALHPWTHAELRSLEEQLARFNMLADYQFAMRSERAAQARYFDILVDRNTPGRAKAERKFVQTDFSDARPYRYLFLVHGWVRDNQVRSFRHLDEVQERLDLEKRQISQLRRPAFCSDDLKGFERSYYSSFWPDFFGCVYERVETRAAYGETALRQARAAVALERFRLARGAYPERLEELVPEFARELPREVYVDEPMRYRRTENGGYLVYSVAVNQVDDGGIAVPEAASENESRRYRTVATQLDWLWRGAP